MIHNVVAIPTIIQPERVISLAYKYAHDDASDEVWIMDNGHSEDDAKKICEAIKDEEKISYINTHGMTIYEQWNYAMQVAHMSEFNSILISNDDIEICDDIVSKLEKALYEDDQCWIVYPAAPNQYSENGQAQQTTGTKADGGLDGSCFMIKLEAFDHGLPPIDERFIWWGGDDDLVMNISTFSKRQKRVTNAWFVHQNEGTVSSNDRFANLHEAKIGDKFLLRQKWRINR